MLTTLYNIIVNIIERGPVCQLQWGCPEGDIPLCLLVGRAEV